MSEPSDFEDWWGLLESEWDHLLVIVFHHLDPQAPALDPPGVSLERGGKLLGRNVLEELVRLKRERTAPAGHLLARYFNATWGLASEGYSRSRPRGWGALCDLCSAEWALDEAAR